MLESIPYILLAAVLAIALDLWLVRWARQRRRSRLGSMAAAREAQVREPVQLPSAEALDPVVGLWDKSPFAQPISTAMVWVERPLPPLPALWQVRSEAVLLLGGAGLVLFNQWLSQELPQDSRWPVWVLSILGLMLFLAGAQTVGTRGLPKWLGRPVKSLSARLGIHPGQAFCLVLSLLFAITATVASGTGPERAIDPRVAVVSWGIGIVLAVIGGLDERSAPVRPSWRAVIGIVLLVAVAFILRGVNTARIPPLLTGDEGSVGISALRFLQGNADKIFGIGWHGFPSLYYFIQSISISVLGQSTQALRIPSAIAGALTVGGVYLMGRTMFGHRTGLVAAVFLAVFHYHVHFSRIGLNNIWDGLGYVVTLGALWHGWQHDRRVSYLLAGLGLGLAQYFYPSSRMLFALIVVWLLMAGGLDWPRLKRALPHLMLMALVTLVTVLPLAWFFARSFDEFMGPLRGQTIMGSWLANEAQITSAPPWLILLRQIGLGLQAYTSAHLNAWYTPGTPMLRPIPAWIFLLGIGLLALRIRDTRTLLLGFWLVAIGVIGGLSEGTPAAQRYVAAAPACALVVGFGMTESASRLANVWPRRAHLIGLLSLVFAGGVAADELRFYFLEYVPNTDFGGYGAAVAQPLAHYLQARTSEWQVLFFGYGRMRYDSIESLQYLAPHITGINMEHPWGSADNPKPGSKNLIFVFLPGSGYQADLAGVQASYPGGRLLQETWAFDGSVVYYLYEYPSVSQQ